LAINTKDRAEI